eukprot:CAMPEP_0113875190 /NCGR_PEP_ID=MMETSP0780_2-20120614/4794_1 /TAXON_ID=652834 /ORGANISM="Palpitomonas bilix" /LENGTH=2514 /DNA_ID=CAMNT_0000861131 /DNA_START=3707 /DNA_END=11248 /DNA_ORIENTATION=+ /assembly_acc=CAM_ASM_000599
MSTTFIVAVIDDNLGASAKQLLKPDGTALYSYIGTGDAYEGGAILATVGQDLASKSSAVSLGTYDYTDPSNSTTTTYQFFGTSSAWHAFDLSNVDDDILCVKVTGQITDLTDTPNKVFDSLSVQYAYNALGQQTVSSSNISSVNLSEWKDDRVLVGAMSIDTQSLACGQLFPLFGWYRVADSRLRFHVNKGKEGNNMERQSEVDGITNNTTFDEEDAVRGQKLGTLLPYHPAIQRCLISQVANTYAIDDIKMRSAMIRDGAGLSTTQKKLGHLYLYDKSGEHEKVVFEGTNIAPIMPEVQVDKVSATYVNNERLFNKNKRYMSEVFAGQTIRMKNANTEFVVPRIQSMHLPAKKKVDVEGTVYDLDGDGDSLIDIDGETVGARKMVDNWTYTFGVKFELDLVINGATHTVTYDFTAPDVNDPIKVDFLNQIACLVFSSLHVTVNYLSSQNVDERELLRPLNVSSKLTQNFKRLVDNAGTLELRDIPNGSVTELTTADTFAHQCHLTKTLLPASASEKEASPHRIMAVVVPQFGSTDPDESNANTSISQAKYEMQFNNLVTEYDKEPISVYNLLLHEDGTPMITIDPDQRLVGKFVSSTGFIIAYDHNLKGTDGNGHYGDALLSLSFGVSDNNGDQSAQVEFTLNASITESLPVHLYSRPAVNPVTSRNQVQQNGSSLEMYAGTFTTLYPESTYGPLSYVQDPGMATVSESPVTIQATTAANTDAKIVVKPASGVELHVPDDSKNYNMSVPNPVVRGYERQYNVSTSSSSDLTLFDESFDVDFIVDVSAENGVDSASTATWAASHLEEDGSGSKEELTQNAHVIIKDNFAAGKEYFCGSVMLGTYLETNLISYNSSTTEYTLSDHVCVKAISTSNMETEIPSGQYNSNVWTQEVDIGGTNKGVLVPQNDTFRVGGAGGDTVDLETSLVQLLRSKDASASALVSPFQLVAKQDSSDKFKWSFYLKVKSTATYENLMKFLSAGETGASHSFAIAVFVKSPVTDWTDGFSMTWADFLFPSLYDPSNSTANMHDQDLVVCDHRKAIDASRDDVNFGVEMFAVKMGFKTLDVASGTQDTVVDISKNDCWLESTSVVNGIDLKNASFLSNSVTVSGNEGVLKADAAHANYVVWTSGSSASVPLADLTFYEDFDVSVNTAARADRMCTVITQGTVYLKLAAFQMVAPLRIQGTSASDKGVSKPAVYVNKCFVMNYETHLGTVHLNEKAVLNTRYNSSVPSMRSTANTEGYIEEDLRSGMTQKYMFMDSKKVCDIYFKTDGLRYDSNLPASFLSLDLKTDNSASATTATPVDAVNAVGSSVSTTDAWVQGTDICVRMRYTFPSFDGSEQIVKPQFFDVNADLSRLPTTLASNQSVSPYLLHSDAVNVATASSSWNTYAEFRLLNASSGVATMPSTSKVKKHTSLTDLLNDPAFALGVTLSNRKANSEFIFPDTYKKDREYEIGEVNLGSFFANDLVGADGKLTNNSHLLVKVVPCNAETGSTIDAISSATTGLLFPNNDLNRLGGVAGTEAKLSTSLKSLLQSSTSSVVDELFEITAEKKVSAVSHFIWTLKVKFKFDTYEDLIRYIPQPSSFATVVYVKDVSDAWSDGFELAYTNFFFPQVQFSTNQDKDAGATPYFVKRNQVMGPSSESVDVLSSVLPTSSVQSKFSYYRANGTNLSKITMTKNPSAFYFEKASLSSGMVGQTSSTFIDDNVTLAHEDVVLLSTQTIVTDGNAAKEAGDHTSLALSTKVTATIPSTVADRSGILTLQAPAYMLFSDLDMVVPVKASPLSGGNWLSTTKTGEFVFRIAVINPGAALVHTSGEEEALHYTAGVPSRRVLSTGGSSEGLVAQEAHTDGKKDMFVDSSNLCSVYFKAEDVGYSSTFSSLIKVNTTLKGGTTWGKTLADGNSPAYNAAIHTWRDAANDVLVAVRDNSLSSAAHGQELTWATSFEWLHSSVPLIDASGSSFTTNRDALDNGAAFVKIINQSSPVFRVNRPVVVTDLTEKASVTLANNASAHLFDAIIDTSKDGNGDYTTPTHSFDCDLVEVENLPRADLWRFEDADENEDELILNQDAKLDHIIPFDTVDKSHSLTLAKDTSVAGKVVASLSISVDSADFDTAIERLNPSMEGDAAVRFAVFLDTAQTERVVQMEVGADTRFYRVSSSTDANIISVKTDLRFVDGSPVRVTHGSSIASPYVLDADLETDRADSLFPLLRLGTTEPTNGRNIVFRGGYITTPLNAPLSDITKYYTEGSALASSGDFFALDDLSTVNALSESDKNNTKFAFSLLGAAKDGSLTNDQDYSKLSLRLGNDGGSLVTGQVQNTTVDRQIIPVGKLRIPFMIRSDAPGSHTVGASSVSYAVLAADADASVAPGASLLTLGEDNLANPAIDPRENEVVEDEMTGMFVSDTTLPENAFQIPPALVSRRSIGVELKHSAPSGTQGGYVDAVIINGRWTTTELADTLPNFTMKPTRIFSDNALSVTGYRYSGAGDKNAALFSLLEDNLRTIEGDLVGYDVMISTLTN